MRGCGEGAEWGKRKHAGEEGERVDSLAQVVTPSNCLQSNWVHLSCGE